MKPTPFERRWAKALKARAAIGMDPIEIIRVGDYYENCFYVPHLCIVSNPERDDVEGISLVTGCVASCSIRHCYIRNLTLEDAIRIRLGGPEGVPEGVTLSCRWNSRGVWEDDVPRELATSEPGPECKAIYKERPPR